MTTVQPQGEDIRKAVKWIAEEMAHCPGKKKMQLINEACLKFDLAPCDAEFLMRHMNEKTS